MLLSALVLLTLSLDACGSSYPSVGHRETLHIVNKMVSPDGFQRSAVLVQGVLPAPMIKGTKGDNFRLNVVNQLTDDSMERGTSIHWHGLLQRGSSWADGAAGVTQCPIAQNHSFEYAFNTGNQAGTFWYHSHFGTQYCDGLRGPLVVYDPHDPYKYMYDESTIITLGEWYHLPSPSVGIIAVADSTLINGKGRYIGGPLVDLSVVHIEYGRRYRFRLISVSCSPNFMFSIDSHELTVIEADGESTLPARVGSIQMFSGQRYSFVLHANKKVDNYWIRALPSSGHNGLSTGYANATNSAILRYKGASLTHPTTPPVAPSNLLRERDLHPLVNPQAPGHPWPGGADVHINLNLSLGPTGFAVNGKSFSEPPIPVLLQMLSGARTAKELLPAGAVYTLPRHKVVELSIPGGLIGGPHPFHLHGHSFSVIQGAGMDALPNYVNPVRRDVVSIGDAGSNVTIRFKTDNPGPWIFHCHIDFHLKEGLAIVFAEDPANAGSSVHPVAWDELCPIYNALPPSSTSIHLVPSST
ncbi:hypothetical protein GALMADRAFT_1358802 [Galerina marginata CBS 339.88]|uniref:Laccase n=1 Tax=Galerina marginata (strain CBS 339.88) TaxID=685588 RepID=A0A067SKA5_GALM3|nr:hypothetical protein GALMADRAFT_1358802 [Galerina marginata CBS 339.88]